MNKNRYLCASDMRRRLLAAGAAWPVLAWTGRARAQTPPKVRHIGLLSPSSPSDARPWLQALLQGLRELGWVEGKNISIEYRYAEGKSDRLPDLAAELVGLKVEIIVTSFTPDALAAKNATSTTPVAVVMAAAGDPVASGLVGSLARPGGNVTGLSQMTLQLAGKRLELLKEMVPKLSRVAVLWNPRNVASTHAWKDIQLPARQLGLQLHSLEVRNPGDFDKAFEDTTRARAGALAVMPDQLFTANMKRIVEFTAKVRLPSIFQGSEFADAGGLATYGPDRTDMHRRAAAYIDKILKGAKPADLPVEQPTRFEMVINLKTAKALGITIPPSVMVRATRVIE